MKFGTDFALDFTLPAHCFYWSEHNKNNIFDEVLRFIIMNGQRLNYTIINDHEYFLKELQNQDFEHLAKIINANLFLNDPYDIFFIVVKGIKTIAMNDRLSWIYWLNRDLDLVRKIYKILVKNLMEINIINNKVFKRLINDLENSVFKEIKIAIGFEKQPGIGKVLVLNSY